MSDPFIGEIQLFGFNFAPNNWAICQGQLMLISQNTALFSLIGTQFGGNGQTTFAAPHFQGMAACAQGQGPGLSPRTVGETFGQDAVTLLASQMPAHSHSATVFIQQDASKRRGTPTAGDAITSPANSFVFTDDASTNTAFANGTIGPSGGSLPHPNRQPYLAVNFCIALAGIYPSRP